MLKKAQNINEILEVEGKLNEVRTEIESFQGQFKLMKHQISLSTLELTFYELLPYEVNHEARPGFGKQIVNALNDGWNAFLYFLIVTIRIWPFVILAVMAFIAFKRIRARKRKAEEG